MIALLLAALAHASPLCSNPAGTLPRPGAAPGTPDPKNPIQHVLVIMQENHSFDNYFGHLSDPRFYGAEIDGARGGFANPTRGGTTIPLHKETNLCTDDPGHDWQAMHDNWNNGALDGFVRTNEDKPYVMGQYDETDLPFYYALANSFTVGDRYFASVLSQTFPNRFYLLAATSFGQTQNLMPNDKHTYAQKTIFDLLDQYGISWKYYNDGEGYLKLFQPLYLRSLDKMRTIADYQADIAAGTLPEVAFLDTSALGEDEHPAADVQYGQIWVSQRIRELMASSAWPTSALFLTYDEGGGFFDHVAPPEACRPDDHEPILPPDWTKGAFDRYGFRVPFVAVSPFAKHHHVTHTVLDHTSILKFIENKFNLPALTARDANADGLTDVFDFQHPVLTIPSMPEPVPDPTRVCNPPNELKLPTSAVSVRSAETGLCLEENGESITFQACNGSRSQKFRFEKDSFHSVRIASERGCLTADWLANKVVARECAREEDQGFEAWNGNTPNSAQFTGWHGDFCFQGAALGEPLLFATCNTSSPRIDFLFQ